MSGVVSGHERIRGARVAVAGCSTDTMHVILGRLWVVDVDHVLDVLDI